MEGERHLPGSPASAASADHGLLSVARRKSVSRKFVSSHHPAPDSRLQLIQSPTEKLPKANGNEVLAHFCREFKG